MDQLAQILRIKLKTLLDLGKGMVGITGKEGMIQKVAEENEAITRKTLAESGLLKESSAAEVRERLQKKIIDLSNRLPNDWQDLCEKASDLVDSKTGFFIKKEKAIELLERYPPKNMEIDEEDFESVFAALRFTQSAEWMHNFFDEAYGDLKPEDFEERAIKLKVLDEKWLKAADKFLDKKYHNVSHLKELGIIFVIPLRLDTPGEAMRIFTLLLHYLNEVPFYSKLFRKFSQEQDFIQKLKSLLRGDVSEGPLPDKGRMSWRIIQRYLAKDDENDPRLFMPHINPEAEHWFKAIESLAKLGPDFAFWKELDFTGGFFGNELVSFNLIDLVMTLVKKEEIKYLYHQQEALWNKIFIEYFGREKMNELIEENIIKGYIEL
ncbi:MAG: hypothetical protein AAB584_02520 [Patescibacteria group bacterium]